MDSSSFLTNYPPIIDGFVTTGEWNNASKVELDNGFLMVQHDQTNLYMLLDVTEDDYNDTRLAEDPWGDFFWVSFDVNLDKNITENVDVLYSIYPGETYLSKAWHIRPGATTGLYGTASKAGMGFGSSINSETPHRIWELAINLQEINATSDDQVRVGLRIHSQTPLFTDEYPWNYIYDFSNLIEINLGESTEPPTSEPETREELEPIGSTSTVIILIIIAAIALLIIILASWSNQTNTKLQNKYRKKK